MRTTILIHLFLTVSCGYRMPGTPVVSNEMDVTIHNLSRSTLNANASIEQTESGQACDVPGGASANAEIQSHSQHRLKIRLDCGVKLSSGYFFSVHMNQNYEVVEVHVPDAATFSKLTTGLEFKVFDSEFSNPETVTIVDSDEGAKDYQYFWHRSPGDAAYVAWTSSETDGDQTSYHFWITLPKDHQFLYAGFPESLEMPAVYHQNGFGFHYLYRERGLRISPSVYQDTKYELVCDDVGCNLESNP